MLPEHIQIIDSGQAVAKQTERILGANQLLSEVHHFGKHKLYSNASIQIIEALTQELQVEKEVKYLAF